MTTYPRANTRAAWYQDNYPGSRMDPNCGVLHTTEGASLPGYEGGATAPNYTAVPDFGAKRLNWFAHYPDECSSRALKNLAGGVETNTANVIQVELVGTCDPGTHAAWVRKGVQHIYWPEAPDWALRDLAAFIAWCHDAHGIPITGPAGRWTAYPESYGAGGQRFTMAHWRAFKGWCGHQHVPENVHGDPGRLDWPTIALYARSLTRTKPVGGRPVVKPTSPAWDAIWEAADDLQRRTPKTALARRASLAVIKAQAARWSVAH